MAGVNVRALKPEARLFQLHLRHGIDPPDLLHGCQMLGSIIILAARRGEGRLSLAYGLGSLVYAQSRDCDIIVA